MVMRRRFFISSIKLILLGVALGILARYLLGDPASSADHRRQFNSPIDREAVGRSKVPDFPLIPDAELEQ